MISSRGKRIFLLGFVCAVVVGLGIIPYWLPPYIYDYGHINWNGADLAQGVTGEVSPLHI